MRHQRRRLPPLGRLPRPPLALYVPTAIPLALSLALLLNANVRGLSFWRTAFYLPEITPAVAAGVLWLRILSPQNGLLNQALAAIGIEGPAWTIDAQWVKPALVIMRLWAVGWELLFAATVLVTLPMIIIFFMAQRSFIQGIATTGLKG